MLIKREKEHGRNTELYRKCYFWEKSDSYRVSEIKVGKKN